MYKGITIRIYPTKSQEELLRKHIGCCRFIWNHLLGIQQENYKNGGKYISKFDMIKMLPSIKKEFEWLNEVSMTSLQRVCDDLNNSYSRFFKKISNFPKFKTKKKSKLSYPVCCNRFYFKDGKVKIQKLGKLKYKADYKGIDFEKITKFINVRISNETDKWILTFSVECENQANTEKHGNLGIDLGVGRLAVVNFEGQKLTYSNINKTKKVKQLKRKLKHVQKVISRKYEVGNKLRGDKSYQKTNRILKYEKLAKRIHRKIANIRKNQRHKITHQLVSLNPMRVVMEDLNVRGMMKNKHLSRAIGEMGFYDFIRIMKYKCEWHGIEFVQANRFFPSSKTCSCCGCIHNGLKLSDRIFECPHCGFTIDRDYNAAINLSNYHNVKI